MAIATNFPPADYPGKRLPLVSFSLARSLGEVPILSMRNLQKFMSSHKRRGRYFFSPRISLVPHRPAFPVSLSRGVRLTVEYSIRYSAQTRTIAIIFRGVKII